MPRPIKPLSASCARKPGWTGEPCGIVSVRTRVTGEGGAVFVGAWFRCEEGEPQPDGHEVDAAQFFGRDELLTLNPVMELSRW